LHWVIEFLLGFLGVGITPSRTMGVHYDLHVAIELLLRFAGHGYARVGLQASEEEV